MRRGFQCASPLGWSELSLIGRASSGLEPKFPACVQRRHPPNASSALEFELSAASPFRVIEQLRLRWELRCVPLDTLAIDALEKVPTAT